MWRPFLGALLLASLQMIGVSFATEQPERRNLLLQRPPPPTVGDVLQMLKDAPDYTADVEEKKALLQQQTPEGVKPEEMIAFLSRRASAAEDVGAITQRLDDLRRIAELAQGSRNESTMLYNAGFAEVIYGDVLRGIAALKTVTVMLDSGTSNVGIEIHANNVLASALIVLGRYEEAETHIGKARWLIDRIKRSPGGWAGFIPSYEGTLYMAVGRLEAARGQWVQADATFRQAHDRMEESARNLDKLIPIARNNQLQSVQLAGRNIAAGLLAEHLVRLGKIDEAELVVRDLLAVNLQRTGRYSIRTMMMLNQLANIMAARGRFGDAFVVLDAVQDIRDRLGMERGNALGMQLADSRRSVLFGLQDWAAGVREDDLLHGRLSQTVGIAAASFTTDLALGLVRVGRHDEAVVRIDRALARLAGFGGESHPDIVELRGVKAVGLLVRGDKAAALSEFEFAVPRLMNRAAGEDDVQSRSIRSLVRRSVLEAYLELLAASPSLSDAADRAFRVADSLHLGRTQQAVAQSAVRAAAADPGLADLIRLEQDGQAERQALFEQLLRLSGLPADQQLPKVMADMRQRIVGIERETQDRRSTLERRFPAYANLVRPKPPTLAEARAVLRPGEAVINLFSTAEATFVWAFRKDGPPAFVRVPVGRAQLARTVAEIRRSVDPGDVDIARRLPDFPLDAAHGLYTLLLQPVVEGWRGADSLLVVANGALAQLPLSLLPVRRHALGSDAAGRYSAYRDIPWLVREAAVTQLPSVNALVTLRRLPPGSLTRNAFIGFGDPEFAPGASQAVDSGRLRNLAVARFSVPTESQSPPTAPSPAVSAAWSPYSDIPPLPDTRDEILALANVLKANPDRDVFLGREASKSRVRTMNLRQTRVLAFATHGLLPGEFPGVDQPSIALANPGDGNHGLLTLDEILALKLDADWVILSACNTAAGDGNGAEAVSGLGRGFFYAGTRALLATHWPVESSSARLLVTNTFANQAAQPATTRAQALRRAMLTVMDQAGDGFTYAHPLFWAPYALIGDGGA